MVIKKLPPRLLDQARYARWVIASHALDNILPAVVPVVQGTGRLDAERCAEDAAFLARRDAIAGNTAKWNFGLNEGEALTDRLNLSALWLFGACEAVRTLDPAIGEKRVTVAPRIASQVNAVKLAFNRPRTLLATHEPAGKHKATDRAPAQPCYRRGSWRGGSLRARLSYGARSRIRCSTCSIGLRCRANERADHRGLPSSPTFRGNSP